MSSSEPSLYANFLLASVTIAGPLMIIGRYMMPRLIGGLTSLNRPHTSRPSLRPHFGVGGPSSAPFETAGGTSRFAPEGSCALRNAVVCSQAHILCECPSLDSHRRQKPFSVNGFSGSQQAPSEGSFSNLLTWQSIGRLRTSVSSSGTACISGFDMRCCTHPASV